MCVPSSQDCFGYQQYLLLFVCKQHSPLCKWKYIYYNKQGHSQLDYHRWYGTFLYIFITLLRFLAVGEGKDDLLVVLHCPMVHKSAPKYCIELYRELWKFVQSEDTSAENNGGSLHLLSPLQQRLVSSYDGFIPLGEFRVLRLVFLFQRGRRRHSS